MDSGPWQIETMERQKVKQHRKERGGGGHQPLKRVKIDIKKGWTPERGGEVGVINISDKKVRLRKERDMKCGRPNSRTDRQK